MGRKLATVQIIDDLQPIKGKDRIVLAKILGWYVIVRKDLFEIGDPVVFFEIDSILPADDARHADLIKYTKGTGRIKTMKMAGVISQGLCMPYSKLTTAEILAVNGKTDSRGHLLPDTDLTEILRVKKYEFDPENRPAHNIDTSSYLGPFPDFVRKTDETRVQKLGSMIEVLQGRLVYITEKLDGSSMTLVWTADRKFMVCSRNCRLHIKLPTKPWYQRLWVWAKTSIFGIKERKQKNPRNGPFWQTVIDKGLNTDFVMDMMLHYYPGGVAVQGELIGPSRNGNKHKLENHKYYIFSIFDIAIQRYEGLHSVRLIAERLHLPIVPVLEEDIPLQGGIDDLVAKAIGRSVVGNLKNREGIVIRTMDGQHSMKAINPNFLLKEEK